jgi:hypothetical protein
MTNFDMVNLAKQRAKSKKINWIFLLILMFFFCPINSENCNCNYTIAPNQNNIDATNLPIHPGDTVCIMSGERKYLRLANFHGDSLHYIVIKNCGGSVIVKNEDLSYGILITHSSFFRFTGSCNNDSTYGIKVLKSAPKTNGLSIDGLSTNYEIDHIEVANTGFAGIMSLTQPTCDRTANRENFDQKNTSIHNNYVHNTGGEGFYIGHSFYSGYPTLCDGKPDTIFPAEIKGLRVYNNLVDSSGWDGIQVSCATSDCEIYDNYIINYGIAKELNQNSGIQIGSGTTGRCYNNAIINGSGTGIIIFGTGNNLFYNNVIVNAGYNYFPEDPSLKIYGMFCADRATKSGASFNFINNTIIAPKTDGIRIYSNQSRNNKFFNNLILKPGSYGNYRTLSQSYIFYNQDVDVDISNNYFSENLSPFIQYDTIANIYQFSATLPISYVGKNVTDYGISTDYFKTPRPSNGQFDIGAFQLDSNQLPIFKHKNNSIYIYPNPNHGKFMIVSNNNDLISKISIFTTNGLKVFTETFDASNSRYIDLHAKLKNGFYVLQSESETRKFTNPLLVR